MEEQTQTHHCDIGDHDVEEQVLRCAHCGRRLCTRHQGNMGVALGSYVACTEHAGEVAIMNKLRWEGFERSVRGR